MFPFVVRPKGEIEKMVRVQGILKYGIMGTWEYSFPEEMKDVVLNYLGFDNEVRSDLKYGQGWKINAVRKLMKCEKIPEIRKDLIWNDMPSEIRDYVSIIPIGVRYDEFREVDNEPFMPNFQEAI